MSRMENGSNVGLLGRYEHDDDAVWGMPFFHSDQMANLSDEQYLAKVLGPKNVGLPLLIPLTLIYIVIFVSGLAGNIAVCIVIVRNKSMHTATNYYLFSLAMSDLLLLLLGLPNDVVIYWQQYPWMFGELMCKGRSLISEMTSYSSVLTIVAFSMERYLAICHPLYSHTMSGFKRAVRIIALAWLVSLVAAIPYFLFTKLNYIDRPLNSGNFLQQSAFCALLDDNIYPRSYPVHELSSFLFFLFPMAILVLLYIRMGLRIRQTSGITRNLPRTRTLIRNNENGSRRVVLQMSRHCCGCLKHRSASISGAPVSPNAARAPRRCRRSSPQWQWEQSTDLGLNEACLACGEVHQYTVNVTNNNNNNGTRAEDTDSFTPRVRSDKRSVTVLLAAVVLAFFLCWAPFHAQRLGYVYFKESLVFRTINEYLYYVSGFLYYLSATVNPVLYNLMSLKYRHAFKQTLCGRNLCRRRRAPRATVHRSYTFRSTTTRTADWHVGTTTELGSRMERMTSLRKHLHQTSDFHSSQDRLSSSPRATGPVLSSSSFSLSQMRPGSACLGRRTRTFCAFMPDIKEEESATSPSVPNLSANFNEEKDKDNCCSISLDTPGGGVKFTIGVAAEASIALKCSSCRADVPIRVDNIDDNPKLESENNDQDEETDSGNGSVNELGVESARNNEEIIVVTTV